MRVRCATSVITLSASAVLALAAGAAADPFYSQTFEGSPNLAGWSNTVTEVTPTGGRTFLGQFDNQAVTLSLSGLPAHSAVVVSFDVYAIGTWDGNDTPGPDRFSFGEVGQTPALDTTFSVSYTGSPYTQSFPMNYGKPGASYYHRSGSIENNTLGYQWAQDGVTYDVDSVFRVTMELPHSGSELKLFWAAAGLQGIGDESWGLDNVSVSVIPAPGALALAGMSAVLLGRRRR